MASNWSFPKIHRLEEDFFKSLNYKITKVLGKGTFGQVLLASSTTGGDDIAVKQLPRGEDLGKNRHFIDEVRALGNLEHPRLVKMRMVAYCPKFYYISMDVYPNGNLQEIIPHLENIYKVCDFVVDIASAVHYLHKNRVVHRDLKVNNVLIDATNHAVLADFGMAMLMPPNQDTCNEGFGNFFLSAPELRKDKQEPFCPFRAEMFTLGVIYWMIIMKSRSPAMDGNFVPRMNERRGQIPYFLRKAIENLLSPEPKSRHSSQALLIKLYSDMPPYSNVIGKELGSNQVISDQVVSDQVVSDQVKTEINSA